MKINSRKYDGSLHRTWDCELVSFDGEMLRVRGEFAETVEHTDLGTIEKGTITHETFWLSRSYNVFRFENADGTLRNHYVNVSLPPTFDGEVVEFVDLDIDVVMWPDGRCETLDLIEFEENSVKMKYPPEVKDRVSETLKEILVLEFD